jgi:hypothetical protein
MSLAAIAANSLDANSLDMNAADDAQNAPYRVDSQFVVAATGRCAASTDHAREVLGHSGGAEVRRVALNAAATCDRLGVAFAAVERQKGWTLPPPGDALYRIPAVLTDASYLRAQSAADRALVALFETEAVAGHDATLEALVTRELPALRRELAGAERAAAVAADGAR